MAELWVPGIAGSTPPSVEDFLKRVHARIEGFLGSCGCEQATVRVQLHDGTTVQLAAIEPEPGFGWVTLRPVPDEDDGPEGPQEIMVPLGSLVRITIEVTEKRTPFGFTLPAAGG